MALAIQLDFFEPFDELSILKKEVKYNNERQENLRRGSFARINELSKRCVDLQDQNDQLRIELRAIRKELDQLKRQMKGTPEIICMEISK
jgi:hypothetical protein